MSEAEQQSIPEELAELQRVNYRQGELIAALIAKQPVAPAPEVEIPHVDPPEVTPPVSGGQGETEPTRREIIATSGNVGIEEFRRTGPKAFRDFRVIGGGDTPHINTTGVRIVAPRPSVLLEDFEVGHLAHGVTVHGNGDDLIDGITLRRGYVHHIWNDEPGKDVRSSREHGVYGANARDITLEDMLIEDCGFGGVYLRDIYSHLAYVVNNVGLLTLRRCILRRGASHAINGGRVEMDGVICCESAINFGVKEVAGKAKDCYSIAPSKDPIYHEDGTGGPRGWHHYPDYPIDGLIKLDAYPDAWDWSAIRAADAKDRFDIAEGMLR